MDIEKTIQNTVYEKYSGAVPNEKELKQVKEIDDALLYHEFLHFTGEKLFDSEPIIKSNPDFSFVPFSEAEKKFMALFRILK